MSFRSNKPYEISTTISDQEETLTTKTDTATAHRQQSMRNISKRIRKVMTPVNWNIEGSMHLINIPTTVLFVKDLSSNSSQSTPRFTNTTIS